MNAAIGEEAAVTVSIHDGLLVAHCGDASFICLEWPARCGACGEMHCWFVNRDGATRCLSCDRARAAAVRVAEASA